MKLLRLAARDMRNPMKYDISPTISGVNLSLLLEMSLSVPSFFAQYNMIAIGRTDAKTSEISSRAMNLDKLKTPSSNDSTIHIIKNNGMVIIGGFVKVDILSAIFNLFMLIIYNIIR